MASEHFCLAVNAICALLIFLNGFGPHGIPSSKAWWSSNRSLCDLPPIPDMTLREPVELRVPQMLTFVPDHGRESCDGGIPLFIVTQGARHSRYSRRRLRPAQPRKCILIIRTSTTFLSTNAFGWCFRGNGLRPSDFPEGQIDDRGRVRHRFRV